MIPIYRKNSDEDEEVENDDSRDREDEGQQVPAGQLAVLNVPVRADDGARASNLNLYLEHDT